MLSLMFADARDAVPPVSVPATQRRDAPSSSLAGKRAVIVEDEGINLLHLKKMLRAWGVLVLGTAANGKEAIDVVLRECPDFVLMDINMPLMNGLEASEHILAQFPVCIVILTAYTDEGYRQRAQDMGTCGFILKPIIANTLLPELEAALDKFHQR